MTTTDTNPQENPITEFYDQVLNKPEPVSVRIRLANYFLDLFAIIIIIYILSLLVFITGFLDGISQLELELFYLIIYFVYYFLFEWSTGRTFGKLITGTKVISESGHKLSANTVLGRTLSRFVPFEPFSFMEGLDGWHDRWSHTMVIKVRR